MSFGVILENLKDYEGPITIGFHDVVTENLCESINDMVYQVVTGKFEIKINKEALNHALRYDKESFKDGLKKGYARGYKEAMDDSKAKTQWIEISDRYGCCRCGNESPEKYPYCPHCGSAMSDELL